MSKQYQKKAEPVKTQAPAHLTKITKAARTQATLSSDLKNLQAGMQVLHEKFNEGKVVSVEGTGENRIATIFFEGTGTKKIMLKFAKLQIVGE
jgi:DNA helicase-2/ATP-dependent DNA helicase PcrA